MNHKKELLRGPWVILTRAAEAPGASAAAARAEAEATHSSRPCSSIGFRVYRV